MCSGFGKNGALSVLQVDPHTFMHAHIDSFIYVYYYRTVLKPVVARAVCHRSSDGAKVKSGSTRAASEIDGVACKHPRYSLTEQKACVSHNMRVFYVFFSFLSCFYFCSVPRGAFDRK